MNEIERAIAVISNPSHWNGEAWNQGAIQAAKETALSALRSEAERGKGCEYCDDNFKFWQTQISGELPNVRFCPMCGKRLEVEP